MVYQFNRFSRQLDSVDAVGLPLGVVLLGFGELVLKDGMVVVVDARVLPGLEGLEE